MSNIIDEPFNKKPYLFVSDEIHNYINKKLFTVKYISKRKTITELFNCKLPPFIAYIRPPEKSVLNFSSYDYCEWYKKTMWKFRFSDIYIYVYINYLKRNKKPVINLQKNKESEAIFNQVEMKALYDSVKNKNVFKLKKYWSVYDLTRERFVFKDGFGINVISKYQMKPFLKNLFDPKMPCYQQKHCKVNYFLDLLTLKHSKNQTYSNAIKTYLSAKSYNKAINEIFKKHSSYANNIINKTEV